MHPQLRGGVEHRGELLTAELGPAPATNEHEERALIERCRSGDDSAFGELVDLHKNLVYGLVYRMVSDRSRVDDLAQEVFLKVYRGLPYFRGEARALDLDLPHRAERLRRGTGATAAPDVSLDQAEDHPAGASTVARPMDSFGDLELRDRLEKAIAQLPGPQRLLIAAHYLEGVQYEALAEAMNIPLGTVKTHLYRAKNA